MNNWMESQFILQKRLYESEMLGALDLTPSAKLFLWALTSHFNPNHETMFPSQATVAKRLGMSERSAERAVKELKEKGLVTYVTKRVNHYVFSEYFFSLVKLSGEVGQNVGSKDRQIVGQTYKSEKKNKKEFFKNFKVYSGSQSSNASVDNVSGYGVPSIEQTREYLKEREKIRQEGFNPLDYSKDEAYKWLKGADSAWLRYSGIARTLVQKYEFEEFYYLLEYKKASE